MPRSKERARSGESRHRRRHRHLRARARRTARRTRPRRGDRLPGPPAGRGARGCLRDRGEGQRRRRARRRPGRSRHEVRGGSGDGTRARRRDRRDARPVRGERPPLRAERRPPRPPRYVAGRGGRGDPRRAGRSRAPDARRGAPHAEGPAGRRRPDLRRRQRRQADLARAGRPAGRRSCDRRRAARERTRARGPHGRDPQRQQALPLARGYPPDGSRLNVTAVNGLPEIEPGADLARLIADATSLGDGDVVVVAQKVVSKAEGRIVRLADVEPSYRARAIAAGGDATRIEVILGESARIVRLRPPLVISQTRHGFVCASAGVDASNAPGADTLVLLPVDPDASAAALRGRLRELTGRDVAVIVSDSFGRAWRQGTTDVAIGCAGLAPLVDLGGQRDRAGYELHATVIAVADEIAGAAQLVMGKVDGIPVAVVRGLDVAGEGTAADVVMPPERDLFR